MSKNTYDRPWQDILGRYFPAFLAFFFPKIDREIDWAGGYQSLDLELEQVTRDAEIGKHHADKLMKVRRLDGDEQVIYVQVEVRTRREESFAPRMHAYRCRIFDRCRCPVVSLAILAGDRRCRRPDRLELEREVDGDGGEPWGGKGSPRFPMVELWDYDHRWHDLKARSNPFATVVMAHLKSLATRKDPDARYRWKMFMFRRLYESGSDRQEILDLLRFVDRVMWLPPDLEAQFEDTIVEYETEKMPEWYHARELGHRDGDCGGADLTP